MEHQDWVTVVLKRRTGSAGSAGSASASASASNSKEPVVGSGVSGGRSRAAVVDAMEYSEAPKKRVTSDSLQELIRRRMELKLTQDKADQLCHFPRYTIKGIESRRFVPTTAQQQTIQKHLGVQLKIEVS
jgi:hypothetical protein